MTHSRRRFLNVFSSFSAAVAFSPFLNTNPGRALLEGFEHSAYEDIPESATDETFWHLIQQAYTVSPNIMNLNNGGVSPQPKTVQDAVEHYNRLSNETPSYYMWRILDKGREPLRDELAALAGCSSDEIAINRNTSEALETVIFGLRLKAGDEVVLTRQDYPNMMNAWKQRAMRDGIKLNWLNFEFPIEDKAAIVKKFVAAFTPKTKVVHITHLINWMGQILPVREIADEAKKRNIEVIVDGAHSFAHLEFKIPDLNCDYFGTSLHKWLCAPFGSGLLYVKEDKISKLYPLFAGDDPESTDIRKFENLGTRSFAIEQAIGHAINFHQLIGSKRKFNRLHHLKKYWTERVLGHPGISIGTSLKPEYSGAIALLQIKDKPPVEVANKLFGDYRIHTVAINWEHVKGVRITPNVYTLEEDLDRLVKAIHEIAG